MNFLSFCNKTIKYSFYLLFLLVPLIFTNINSELFELNKMWITWGLSIVIFFAWMTKIVISREIKIQRTPLDIPLFLFLLSQIVSTILSIDPRTSVWGYYSRFNGGLLSTITYIFLYYAFVSNLGKKETLRTIGVSLFTGLLVSLWGLPSHFGYDPTCLIFTGNLDVACWTEAFKPTIRIFSTLGQPAWIAAYLAILIPISLSYTLKNAFTLLKLRKFGGTSVTASLSSDEIGWYSFYLTLVGLFYACLLFANTRAGFIAFWIVNILFWGVLFLKRVFSNSLFIRQFLIGNALFLILTFLFATPIPQINTVTLSGLKSLSARSTAPAPTQTANTPAAPVGELGGTDSGTIRLYVWRGAINIWKANPLFGTGVETFAYSYYQHRPVGHNQTTEWDYLYNKAHNEYLNYLATTGLFGFLSYISISVLFIFVIGKYLFFQKKKEEDQNTDIILEQKSTALLIIGLTAGYLSIPVTNFFGFSVVIINLYFFLIPAFTFLLADKAVLKKTFQFSFGPKTHEISLYQWSAIIFLFLFSGYGILTLFRFWSADTKYALAHNLDGVSQFQQAYPLLQEAYALRTAEPVITDELAINSAALAYGFYAQKEATQAAQLAEQASSLSLTLVTNHPKNVVYWKNRVRVMYTLSQIDPKYLQDALQAIVKAYELAPTDVKIMYNLGVLYGQTGQVDKGITLLEKAATYRPEYRDIYYALALFYRQKATGTEDASGKVVYPEFQAKAEANANYILKNLSPEDKPTLQLLESWGTK